MTNCECSKWARAGNQVLLTDHHPACESYSPENDAAKIISNLLDGIVAWAADEDGVHPDCWESFRAAAIFVGRFDLVKQLTRR